MQVDKRRHERIIQHSHDTIHYLLEQKIDVCISQTRQSIGVDFTQLLRLYSVGQLDTQVV